LAELQIHFQIEQIKNASDTQNLIFTAPTSVHKVLAPIWSLEMLKGREQTLYWLPYKML